MGFTAVYSAIGAAATRLLFGGHSRTRESMVMIQPTPEQGRSRGQAPGGRTYERTSLPHMTRGTEARSLTMRDWITKHVMPGRLYRLPRGHVNRRRRNSPPKVGVSS